MLDFTRLKLVQGKKQEEQKAEMAAKEKAKKEGLLKPDEAPDVDITAEFDAGDDVDVVF